MKRDRLRTSHSKSSTRWLKEHFADDYVHRARESGYRSRAVYKLIEIHEKTRLLLPGATVVDLGASPGSWSQFAARSVGNKGTVVAMDLLPMKPLPRVKFVQGDLRETVVFEMLLNILAGRPVDLVISDIAPNFSGIRDSDGQHSICLAELALDFAQQCLPHGGDFLVKVFHSENFSLFLKKLRGVFSNVSSLKPRASRARSSEQYLLARNYQG